MSTPFPGERVKVEFGSISSVNLRISANICMHKKLILSARSIWIHYQGRANETQSFHTFVERSSLSLYQN